MVELSLPLFLAIGSLGAWISGRLFRRKWSREEQLHDAMSLTR